MSGGAGGLSSVSGGAGWRLILDAECGPAWNMAVDEAILDAVALRMSPPTIRMYRWDGPAVSLGRSQNVAAALNMDSCRGLGVPIVRRPTGGRAVLHGGDQTVSIVAPQSALGRAGSSVVASYRLLSEGIVAALSGLGVQVRLATATPGDGRSGDCFAAHARIDLVSDAGGKLVGSAQRRRDGVILQQSSIRHFVPQVEPSDVFVGPVSRAGYPLAGIDEDEVEEALIAGFGRALGAAPLRDTLSAWELERTVVLVQRCALGAVVDSAPTV